MLANRIFSNLTVTAAILTSGLLAQGFLETFTDPPLVNAASPTTKPNRAAPPQTPPDYKTPLAEQRMAGGYWRVDHTFEPMLIITNFLENMQLPVTPVLYAADGTEYRLPTVILEPAGVSSIDIRAALSAAPDELKGHFSEYGSVAVKYVWHWAGAASAMVQNRDTTRSLNFNFELQSTSMTMQHGPSATVREGLWWKEDAGVKGALALVNVARHPIDVQTQVVSENGAFEREWTVHLKANETQNLDLLQDNDGLSGGIRVTYKGTEKDLALAGGLENPHEGYSAQIPFLTVSPDKQPSAIAVSSVGLMLGAPDPMMNFPSGTQFGVYLALRNTSSSPILVSPTLYYMQGPSIQKTALKTLTLTAGQAKHWTPEELSKELGLPNLSGMINLTFSYLGGPSDVIMANGSIDQTRNYVFEINMQTVGRSQAKELKAWDVSGGNDTMISLLNLGENDQDLTITFSFDNGKYKLPVHLNTGGSVMLNVSDVIAMQQPDADGNKIPPGTLHGTAILSGASGYAEWMNVGVAVGVFNASLATCGDTCPTCFGYSDFKVSQISSTAPVGSTATFEALAFGQDNVWHNVSAGMPANGVIVTWSSSNTNVATSQGNGSFTGVAAGTFSAQAAATLLDENADCPEGSHSPCPNTPYPGSAGGTIKPVITSISPTFLNAGDNKKSLTINGSGFGSSPTVNLPQGVTLDSTNQQTSTTTQIQLSAVDVAASAYIGANSITVTASGQTSAPAGFTIDGPDHAIVNSDVLGHCSGCTTAVKRTIILQVIKFSGSAASVIPIGEVASASGWNCSQTNPGVLTTPCAEGVDTDSNGMFPDSWSIASDTYSPAGCGFNFTTHWQWCTAPKTCATLTGYTHTNAINMNGVVNPPSQFPAGQAIYP
jgi:hypothetical protein